MKRTEYHPDPESPRNLRLDARMTAEQVYTLIGIAQSTYSRFERGGTNPTVRTLAFFYAAVGRADLIDLMWPHLPKSARARVEEIRRDRAALSTLSTVPDTLTQLALVVASD